MNPILSKLDPPLGAYLVCKISNTPFDWGKENSLILNEHLSLTASHSISRHLARLKPQYDLYPKNVLSRTEVDHWLTLTSGPLGCNLAAVTLCQLNKALGPSTYITSDKLTIADLELFSCLYKSKDWNGMLSNGSAPLHVARWYNALHNQVAPLLAELPEETKQSLNCHLSQTTRTKKEDTGAPKTKKEDVGKFVELPGAEMGKVVVRFPPEASGYLHIGHAKAALLNQYYQKAFKGKLIMRFDDTNPEKEKADYEKVILEDLKLLEIQPDVFTHSSDHFDRMLSLCEQLMQKGLAYCDNTDPETMKKEREERVESKNRSNSFEFNKRMWEEMKKGTPEGQNWCVRAKIDMNSPNGCMRDPTIYRCKNEPHVKTGDKYKAYPTYDFACPIVDSVEGVTHALRTTEYHDRDDQYFWFIEKLSLRPLHIYEYSRLNMNNTVLSKRKLTWFVNEGLVDGWDDPRFPTVRGIMRRGMTVEGLKDFIVAQGSSRSVVNMEWDKIWAFNKKVIDREAPRYTALQDSLVPVRVANVIEDCKTAQKHPKDPSKGNKSFWVAPTVFIEEADACELKKGENATFINWGNLMIKNIIKDKDKIVEVEAEPNLENTDYKKTLKLTWLAETPKASWTPIVCAYFGHLVNKNILGKDEDFKQFVGHTTRHEMQMVGDDELKSLKAGDIIQLQRKGFFRVDQPYRPLSRATCKEGPIVLFFIPDGHSKETPASLSTKKLASMSTKEKEQSAKGKKAEKSPQEESKPPLAASHSSKALDLHNSIKEQGDKIRTLKSEKADKNVIMAEVDILKTLKANFKNETGSDWTPDIDITNFAPAETPVKDSSSIDIHNKIKLQGDKVRILKSEKADKQAIKAEVDTLLSLKGEFKALTGLDWKPDIDIGQISNTKESAPKPQEKKASSTLEEIHEKIKAQGDKVRSLKSSKAEKDAIKAEVDILLALKSDFKNSSGLDWKPDVNIEHILKSSEESKCKASTKPQEEKKGKTPNAILEIHEKIKAQGDKVRALKSSKAEKDAIKAEVDVLLSLKADFKNVSGVDWKTDLDCSSLSSSTNQASKTNKPAEKAKPAKEKVKASVPSKPTEDGSGGLKKQTRLGLEARKEENLADWYSQVITKAEMIEYYNVSGCYILRPWSYSIWKSIHRYLGKAIEDLGVEDAYFPIFVSKDALEKEKTHIEDFSPEVAWVTRSGSSEMAEPVAIRPTSETIMYPAFAKWIQSHRDLPIRLNQWNNVVRWEFKQPTPFLRTREFLWQEGHSAFASRDEAIKEVYQILECYADVYEKLLAIPIVRGRKTEKEKFAGGDFTLTTEAFVSANGRGIQGATSHHLGQNFAKMIDIVYDDPHTGEKQHVYQNSWGLTTRTIGVMVMVHGDNKGLILPPRVAPTQVVIMPVGITAKITDGEKDSLIQYCENLKDELTKSGLKVKCDLRDHITPAWKFNHWELKGVPLRLELGPREMASNQVFAVRRDTGEKRTLSRHDIKTQIENLLDEVHNSLYNRALGDLNSRKIIVNSWSEFVSNIEKRNLMLAPFCGIEECEDLIKKDSAKDEPGEVGAPAMGAKALCIPLEQPEKVDGLKCVHPSCGKDAEYFTLFGRSY